MIASALSSGSSLKEIRRKSSVSRPGRSLRLPIDQRLVLKPIGVLSDSVRLERVVVGDKSTQHIGGGDPPVVSEVNLRAGVYEVGREKPADIVIPVPTVSARHALIRISDTEVTVTDLESTNGTYINKMELDPMKAEKLTLGNEVIFGDEHLAMFELVDEPSVDVVDVKAEV